MEPISGREVLTPEDFDHDATARDRARRAFVSPAGTPQGDTPPALLEEILSILGGTPVARVADALEAMSVLPASRFTSKLKAVAAVTAARLYAAESMAYRTTGLALEWLARNERGAGIEEAFAAFSVECALTRRFTHENLTDAADRLHTELRKANPYLRVLLRDARPRNVVDRAAVAHAVLARCGGGTNGLGFAELKDSSFPALDGRTAREGSDPPLRPDWVLGQEQMAAESAKLVTGRVLTLVHAAEPNLGPDVIEELLDLVVRVYAFDSSVVRTVQLLKRRGIEKAKVQCDLTALHAVEAVAAVRSTARRLLARHTTTAIARELVARLTIIAGRDLDGTSDRVVAHYVEAGLTK